MFNGDSCRSPSSVMNSAAAFPPPVWDLKKHLTTSTSHRDDGYVYGVAVCEISSSAQRYSDLLYNEAQGAASVGCRVATSDSRWRQTFPREGV